MTRTVETAMQVTIIFIGGTAFQGTHIGGCEWGISLALGSCPFCLRTHVLTAEEASSCAITLSALVHSCNSAGSSSDIRRMESEFATKWVHTVLHTDRLSQLRTFQSAA